MPSAAPEPPLTPPATLDPIVVARFRAELERQHRRSLRSAADDRIGLAVSGGPDSLGLLLLAHAALPDRIEAATVDHGLRPDSAVEAAMVAALCGGLGIRHAILKGDWRSDAPEGLQAAARAYRYRELTAWCARRRLRLLVTAHHADDQAETLLMRLSRGAGVGGLGSIRPARRLMGRTAAADPADPVWQSRPIWLIRPLLRFSKRDLAAIVRAAGIVAADDPSNDDARFDRTRARRLLAGAGWLDPVRLAASASHLADANEALDWAAATEYDRRVEAIDGLIWQLDPAGVPDEILRRIVQALLHTVEDRAVGGHAGPDPAGPDLTRFISRLHAGQTATMWHVLARPGPLWRFTVAPPRRG